MYETFYGLKEKPFSMQPDPSYLYLSEGHRSALVMLEYGLLSNAGISVLTGAIGSGKTTLTLQLLNQIEQNVAVGLISNTNQSFGELLQWVLLAFKLEYRDGGKVELYETFVNYVMEIYAQGRRTILIVDEAQNLSSESLEELRMLSNINADKDQALQIILVGQPELRKKLCHPGMLQFAQRIAVEHHLKPLNYAETKNYIRHRIKVADGRPELFDVLACKAAYYFSQGIPRLINILCDTALVYGFGEGMYRITGTLISEVAHEKIKGGLFPAPVTKVSKAAKEEVV